MAGAASDNEFLAQLVARGQLAAERARELARRVAAGEDLDALLTGEVGWKAAEVARLRRTRAGELPELPGLTVIERLGRGGTADVWRARDDALQCEVALKVMLPALADDSRAVDAFVREAKLLRRIDHPGVVKCHGVAKFGRTYFTRLELIDGPSLQEELDKGRVFTEAEALRFVLDVARALGHLESLGLVHRDVKPGNVLVAPDGRAVLIDLGFAAFAGEARADGASDKAAGTVAYLSPEQARGGAVADIRSDVYSLGVSLFQLIVGRLPFEAADDRDVLAMQVLKSLDSPELKRRGVSPHLHYLVQRMMSKEPSERFESWAALVADVEGQLAGQRGLDWRSPTDDDDPLRGRRGRRRR
jgi:serine/threonine-protein kinase